MKDTIFDDQFVIYEVNALFKRKLQLLCSAFLGVAAMSVFLLGFSNPLVAHAARSRFEVLNNNTSLPNGYGHTPVMNSDTQIKTAGCENWFDADSNAIDQFNTTGTHVNSAVEMTPSNNDVTHWYGDNKPSVTYTHVLNYNGEWLDLKITINGYQRNSNSVGLGQVGPIVFSRNSIQQLHASYNYVDETWQYVNSSGQPQPINGYLTFTDIDTYQNIEFDQSSSSRISRAIVPTADSFLTRDDIDQGCWGVFAHTSKNLPDSDPRTQVMVAYSDPNAQGITFKYGTDYQSLLGANYVGKRIWDTNTMFGYSYEPITSSSAPYSVDSPAKYAYINNAQTKTGSLPNNDSNFNWKIHQNIPYYNGRNMANFDETDILPQATSYVNGSMSIVDKYGVNRTNWFNVSTSGNNLYMKATGDALSNSAFYNNQYTFSFATKPDVDAGPVVDGDNFSFTNSVSLNADNKTVGTDTANIKTPGYVTANIVVNHYDKRTGELLKSDKYNPKFLISKGYDYDYKYDNTLKKHLNDRDIPYKLVSDPNEYKGHLTKGGDYVFNFYYEAGLIEAGVKKVTIPTVPKTSDMAVKADLSTNLGYSGQDDANKNSKITVNLTDQNTGKVVQSKDYTVATLPKSITFTVPKNSLNAGEHHSFKVSFSNYDANDVYIWSDNLATDGYAAQQGTISDSLVNHDVNWKGVVQTYHVYNEPMKVQYESLKMSQMHPDKTKTGFGVSLDDNIEYQNDLGNHISNSTNGSHRLFDYYLPADTEATPRTYPVQNYQIKMPKHYPIDSSNNVTIDGKKYSVAHGYVTYNDNRYSVKKAGDQQFVSIPAYYDLSNVTTTVENGWTYLTGGQINMGSGSPTKVTMKVRLDTDGSILTHDQYITYKGKNIAIVNGKITDSSFNGVSYRIVGNHVYTNQNQSYLIRNGNAIPNATDANVDGNGTEKVVAKQVKVGTVQTTISPTVTAVATPTTKGANGETAVSDNFRISAPNVSVEKDTGLVLTDKQLANLKQVYNINTVAGHNNWYTPFWDKLGVKPFEIKSAQTIGVNQMNVDVSSNFELFANFIGYNGSSTISHDQFVFQPQSDLNGDGPAGESGGTTTNYNLD